MRNLKTTIKSKPLCNTRGSHLTPIKGNLREYNIIDVKRDREINKKINVNYFVNYNGKERV